MGLKDYWSFIITVIIITRNLIIGNVVDADFDDTGVAKYALLEPAVNVGSLEQIFIVTEYNAG